MAEFVASVVGLVSTVKTCIDLWDIITTACHASDDLASLATGAQTQRVRFILWSEITTLSPVAVSLTSREGEPSTALSRTTEASAVPHLHNDFILRHFQRVMDQMERSLRETESLLSRYSLKGRPHYLERLKQRLTAGKRPSGTLAVSSDTGTPPESSQETGMRTVWDRVKWTVQDKQALGELVAALTSHNDGLESVLGLAERQMSKILYRRFLRVMSTSPLAESIVETRYIDAAPADRSASGTDDLLVTYCQLCERAKCLRPLGSIEDNREISPSSTSAQSTRALVGPGLGDTFRLDRFQLQLPEATRTDPPDHRQVASYKGQRVLVEWRYYSTKLSRERLSILDNRIHMLAMQLRQSSTISEFRVLPCVGYVHIDNMHRYGIVFRTPSTSPRVGSLRQLLVSDFKKKVKRDLDSRLRLARSLAGCLYRFFSTGWIHKNVRSDSILLFHANDDPTESEAVPEMYLGGYHFTRRESPQELTEDLPTVLRSLPENLEWKLYAHPRYRVSSDDADGATRSTVLFDTYSLGIVLLEIALWCPVIKLCSRDWTIQYFQSVLWEKFEQQVKFNVGVKYAEVVHRCLTGDFGLMADGTDAERVGEEREAFLAVFEKFVVTGLESPFAQT